MWPRLLATRLSICTSITYKQTLRRGHFQKKVSPCCLAHSSELVAHTSLYFSSMTFLTALFGPALTRTKYTPEACPAASHTRR